MDKVAKRLRAFSTKAVMGCWQVWKTAGGVWREREKEERARERALVEQGRRAARMARREKRLEKRAKVAERSRKSFIEGIKLRNAAAGAKAAAELVHRKLEGLTWYDTELLKWREWSPGRLLEWWKNQCQKQSRERRKQNSGRIPILGGAEPERGQRTLWESWGGSSRRANKGGVLARRRVMGDGADDPG